MITVVHGPEWVRLRAQLRKEEKTLDEHLFRAQRRVVETLVKEAQTRVRRLELTGGPSHHTGLRARVARGVRARHRRGTSVVDTRMKEADERNLPFAMDRPQGWRHPFFGDRSQWYQQRPVQPGWFTGTFKDADERLSDELFDELQASVERLDDSS